MQESNFSVHPQEQFLGTQAAANSSTHNVQGQPVGPHTGHSQLGYGLGAPALTNLVGLTPTGVQRHETKSQPRLISRPDRGRQPTDGCGPLLRCAYIKGGEGLGAQTTKFAVTYFPLPHHPRTDH
jgi:hypothetical protein